MKIIIQSLLFLTLTLSAYSQNKTLSDTAVARVLYEKALSLRNKGQYDTGTMLLDSAKQIYNYHLKNKPSDTTLWIKWFNTQNERGYNLILQQKYIPALDILLYADSVAITKLDTISAAFAYNYKYTGMIYDDVDEYDLANDYFLKARILFTQLFGPEYYQVGACNNNLGVLYYNKGDYKKSLGYFLSAYKILQKVLPAEHPFIPKITNNIGSCYMRLRENYYALEYYQHGLFLCRKIYGEIHFETASAYEKIGMIHFNHKEYKRALKYFFKTLHIYKQVKTQNKVELAQVLANISHCYFNLRQIPLAYKYLMKTFQINQKIYPPNHHKFVEIYLSLANLQNNPYQVLRILYKALQLYTESHPTKHPILVNIYDRLARCHFNVGLKNLSLLSAHRSLLATLTDFNNPSPYSVPTINNNALSDNDYFNALKLKASILLKIAQEK